MAYIAVKDRGVVTVIIRKLEEKRPYCRVYDCGTEEEFTLPIGQVFHQAKNAAKYVEE